MKILKYGLLRIDIKNIKEVFVKSSNKRFLEVTFLNKRIGGYDKVYLELRESLKNKGVKTYFQTLKYINNNYDKDLNLRELKGGLKE